MDKSTQEVRLAQWKEIVRQCQSRPEGQTAASWLRENGISDKKYYYWQRRIRKKAYDELKSASLPTKAGDTGVAFAEIPVHGTCFRAESGNGFHPDAIIQTVGMTVAVSNSISAELLGRIIEAASHAC